MDSYGFFSYNSYQFIYQWHKGINNMAYEPELFEQWFNYYFPKANETDKAFAKEGWRGKAHLDFMRSENDRPVWLKCVEAEENK